jgi:SAM-dependent methyltransferase
MNSLANGYERIAAEFLARRGRAGSTEGVGTLRVRAWAHTLSPRAEVLDLGCGSGFPITNVLIDAGLRVSAVDASPTLVAAFRHNFPNIPVACETVEESTFFGRTFEAILAWGLWFLLPVVVQQELPRRLAAILRPSGRLLMTAPAQPLAWLDAMTGEQSHSLGAETYRQLLKEAGFSVVREYEDEGENHYYDAVKDSP